MLDGYISIEVLLLIVLLRISFAIVHGVVDFSLVASLHLEIPLLISHIRWSWLVEVNILDGRFHVVRVPQHIAHLLATLDATFEDR